MKSSIACHSFELGLLLMNKMHKTVYWSIPGVTDEGRYVHVHTPAHTAPSGLQLCRRSMLASVSGVFGQIPGRTEGVFIL